MQPTKADCKLTPVSYTHLELAAALSAGEISPAQYALALREAEALARALPAREGELAAFCRTWFARLREQLEPEG